MSKKNGGSGKMKKVASSRPTDAVKANTLKVQKDTRGAKRAGKSETVPMETMAERLEQSARAFRADVKTLLVEAKKVGDPLSSKLRKTFAGVAKEYRKAAKDLKKLAAHKGA